MLSVQILSTLYLDSCETVVNVGTETPSQAASDKRGGRQWWKRLRRPEIDIKAASTATEEQWSESRDNVINDEFELRHGGLAGARKHGGRRGRKKSTKSRRPFKMETPSKAAKHKLRARWSLKMLLRRLKYHIKGASAFAEERCSKSKSCVDEKSIAVSPPYTCPHASCDNVINAERESRLTEVQEQRKKTSKSKRHFKRAQLVARVKSCESVTCVNKGDFSGHREASMPEKLGKHEVSGLTPVTPDQAKDKPCMVSEDQTVQRKRWKPQIKKTTKSSTPCDESLVGSSESVVQDAQLPVCVIISSHLSDSCESTTSSAWRTHTSKWWWKLLRRPKTSVRTDESSVPCQQPVGSSESIVADKQLPVCGGSDEAQKMKDGRGRQRRRWWSLRRKPSQS